MDCDFLIKFASNNTNETKFETSSGKFQIIDECDLTKILSGIKIYKTI